MYVESLKLENIKAFESLVLDFKRPNGKPLSGMNVFVGGNASGKSTILKCIAMAISGPLIATQLLISPEGWIRHANAVGGIEICIDPDLQFDTTFNDPQKLSGDAFPANLVFNLHKETLSVTIDDLESESYEYTSDVDAPAPPLPSLWDVYAFGWFLGAYGPFRRLNYSSNSAERFEKARGRLASCLTLFQQDAALGECEAWLKQEYFRMLEERYNNETPSSLVADVTKFLNDGLMPTGFQIEKITVDNVLVATPNGGEMPMRDLSDGCRCAYSLILDIIHKMSRAYRGQSLFEKDADGRLVVNKPGVILIDELEAHLHPAWQHTICDWLKTRFPNIQFFITTHSPLIAQNADEGGLFVLPLPNEIASGQSVRQLTPHEQERVTLGSAEATLLGEAFGLEYTWSSETQLLVDRWEELAAKRNANGGLNQKEQNEYSRMINKMKIVFDNDPEDVSHA